MTDFHSRWCLHRQTCQFREIEMEDLIFLEEQHVSPELIDGVRRFREQYPVAEEAADRIVRPMITFYGNGDRRIVKRGEYPADRPEGHR